MSDMAVDAQRPDVRQQTLIARMERLPFHFWHVKIRLIVGVATFFDGADAMMLAYIMPVLLGLWKIPPTKIGLLISTGYIGQLIGAVFFGWFAEKYGRIRSLTTSVLILALGSFACAFSWGYASLLVFRLVQGLGLGGEIPVAATYINEVAQAKGRGRFFGLFELLFTVGLIGAGVMAYFVIPHLGWKWMFVVGALPALATPVFLRGIPESPRWLGSKGRLDEAEAVVTDLERITTNNGQKQLPALDSSKQVKVVEKATDWKELFQGIYLKRTIVLWVVFFLSYFLVYGLQLWVPTLFTRVYKVAVPVAIKYGTYGQICGLIGQLIFAMAADWMGRRAWFAILFAGMFITLGLMWLTGVPQAWMLAVLYCLFVAVMSPIAILSLLYATEIYPTRIRALGFSIGTAFMRIAAFLGPMMVGVIYGASSVTTVFAILAVVSAVGVVVSLSLVVETKSKVLEELAP
jgi:putative MFS transporter